MNGPAQEKAIEALVPASGLRHCPGAGAAYERLARIYDTGLERVRHAFGDWLKGTPPPPGEAAVYPYLCVEIREEAGERVAPLAYGKVSAPGIYGTTITAPGLFRDYLHEQLDLLLTNYEADIYVGRSRTPIPLSFAIERADAQLSPLRRRELRKYFTLPDLAATHDHIADGDRLSDGFGPKPLTLFSAERVDYSLHRLRHYTATSPEHFQEFVLFTNYQRYVDEFVEFAAKGIEAKDYERFVEPGDRVTEKGRKPSRPRLLKMPQMPAYHLVRNGKTGITLVNIGIGPSNAKTMTDHLAVLRPHVWLMVGHCGGLRRSQRLGDYVLAHAYLRDDHVLDQALPPAIPLPTIAEMQLALSQAVHEVTGLKGRHLKDRLRTGTVVTTDDRNWELRYDVLAVRFNQSRAIAIDMESATIAANGYRFRVPYGTLLCVSDRPLHGEIKLPGMADAFYEESVSQHLQIGIRALELLRNEASAGTLHSRKLRSFDEPAFR